ncbi:hypothetical protein AYI68_g3232 [Smittium mucronatum]|uniref:Uncharacterized protein n=1 Tax=Smittium mucronatum TaxID=133383 RepID=A0A1R0H0I0_9FUNG|nr:hypothetical protein AYI68_g3232 [Smittium mucronatum]
MSLSCLLPAIKAKENFSVKRSEIILIAMGVKITSQLRFAEIHALNDLEMACSRSRSQISTLIDIFYRNEPKQFDATCDLCDIASQ